MNANGLFPRRAAKQKRLVRMISGVSILTSDISKYPCLSQASTSDHYSTTRLQYSIIKMFTNIYKITFSRLDVHKIFPTYELILLDGPLKHFQQSHVICNLSKFISEYLEILKENSLTWILMKCGLKSMMILLNYLIDCTKLSTTL